MKRPMKRGLDARPHISYRRFLVRRRWFGAGPRYIKVLPGAGLLQVPLSVPQRSGKGWSEVASGLVLQDFPHPARCAPAPSPR